MKSCWPTLRLKAVYNPLPNQLARAVVDQSGGGGETRAVREAAELDGGGGKNTVPVRERCGVKIGEAFMVKTHPQWLRTRELIHKGVIGELRAIVGAFSYFTGSRERAEQIEWGGGGMMTLVATRLQRRDLFLERSRAVAGLVERDPDFKTDRLVSVILEFPSGQSVFTCSTQLVPYQRMQFLGTKGRIEMEIPLMRRTTGQRGFLWMMGATYLAGDSNGDDSGLRSV